MGTVGTARSLGPSIYHGTLLSECGPDRGSEVRTLAARAFDAVVMRIVGPHAEAVHPRPLSRVFWVVVDRDLALRNRPNVPGSEWSVSCLSPLYRAATRLPSEILDGYTRPFPSQVGQGRNAGTFE
jgi:hypothetical protein